MSRKNIVQILAKKKNPNTTLQKIRQGKNSQNPSKKAPNTTLQKLCKEKKNAQIQAKKAPNTTLQRVYLE